MKLYLIKTVCGVLDFFVKNKIVVLFYHSISKRDTRLSVSPEMFERQIKYLRDDSWNLIGPNDLHKMDDLKGKNIMICFDDGYKDNISTAKPILDKYNFKATVFVSTKFIGHTNDYVTNSEDRGQEMMSKKDLLELEKSGWTVANHFHSHNNLVDLSEKEIGVEIDKSCETLSGVGISKDAIKIFSYPRNKVNKKVLKAMKDSGAKMAFGGKRKMIDGTDDFFNMPRVEVDREVDMDKFKVYLCSSFYFVRNLINR